jgi:UDP-3-O-[3-hydroxymyristoyl] glucosamine N-acyltransferase
MMANFSFKDLESIIGDQYEIAGEKADINFNNFAPLDEAGLDSLSWIRYNLPGRDELLSAATINTIICDKKEILEAASYPNCKVFIKVDNPRLVFSRIVAKLYESGPQPGIHPSSTIHPEAVIGKNVYIGPNCSIGKSVIGDNTIIHGNVYIFDKVSIGQHVTIMPNSTIGGVGFGYEKNDQGEFELFPHIGGVVIDDFVDIGANTCIDRGTLGNTIIGRGTKVDNLVHIAHNVKIGKNCAIIAHAMIGGSTRIKDDCWVAPTSCIRDGITIGTKATVGLGAVVVKSIPDTEIWIGNPAKQFIPKSKD